MADELSREALLIYLENLRVLETLAVDAEQKKLQINESLKRNCDMLEPTKPCLDIGPLPEKPPKFLGYGYCSIICPLSFLCFIIVLPMAIIPDEYHSEQTFRYVSIISFIVGFITLCITLSRKKASVHAYETAKENNIRNKQKYDEECREYRMQKSNAERKRCDLTSKANHSLSICDGEISDIKAILQKAYAANIIPLMFRDIHGVYYLYDYLSTSNETLTSALMQYNLETIKQKLDKVIELQGKAIIQQAQANAALYAQNQQILETAQATMNNTAVAAQYAQIAAVNSAVSVKLQRQQLAYQEMDFWLK